MHPFIANPKPCGRHGINIEEMLYESCVAVKGGLELLKGNKYKNGLGSSSKRNLCTVAKIM